MYKVVYEFTNENGETIRDELTNNGRGWSMSDAKSIANQIRNSSIEQYRHVIAVPMN